MLHRESLSVYLFFHPSVSLSCLHVFCQPINQRAFYLKWPCEKVVSPTWSRNACDVTKMSIESHHLHWLRHLRNMSLIWLILVIIICNFFFVSAPFSLRDNTLSYDHRNKPCVYQWKKINPRVCIIPYVIPWSYFRDRSLVIHRPCNVISSIERVLDLIYIYVT